MMVDPSFLQARIENELSRLRDARVVEGVQQLLVAPHVDWLDWDYGAPGERMPCWVVLEHQRSRTGIAYCETGFGPRCPWGLIGVGDANTSMGMDSAWFPTFLDAFLDCWASSELHIWRVFLRDGAADFPGQPLTGEMSSSAAWARLEAIAGPRRDWRYHVWHSVRFAAD